MHSGLRADSRFRGVSASAPLRVLQPSLRLCASRMLLPHRGTLDCGPRALGVPAVCARWSPTARMAGEPPASEEACPAERGGSSPEARHPTEPQVSMLISAGFLGVCVAQLSPKALKKKTTHIWSSRTFTSHVPNLDILFGVRFFCFGRNKAK